LSIQFAIIERIHRASGITNRFSVNQIGSQVKINLLFTPFFRRDEMRNLIMCMVILLAGILTGPVFADQWTTPVPVTSGINSPYDEWTPYLSYDGKSLYFSRLYTDTYYEARIFEAKRSQPSGAFTSVQEVFSTDNHVITPWVSPDNLRMYYHEESGVWQIKVSQRASVNDPWSEGTVVPGLPSTSVGFSSLSADELTIVFNNPDVGGWDMYIATRSSRDFAFGTARNLSEINTAGTEQRPFLSPDALSIYWSLGGKIYEATRSSLNDPFSNVTHMTAFDIPNGYSMFPAISSDGKAFYFAGNIGSAPPDIYVSYNIPEPATLLLLGLGGFILRKRRA
jgi:hypothetical protein